MKQLKGQCDSKYHYAVNARGTSHVMQKKPCQDSFEVRYVEHAHRDAIAIAAVADGVGSAAASDAGSLCAARAAVHYCSQRLARMRHEPDEAETLACIQAAFREAMRAIERHQKRNPALALRDLDTTLCLAIQCGTRLCWGQSGDSGLIAAFEDGTYEMLTRQQRDAAGRVFPLRFGEHFWEFGAAKRPVCSFLLATDGVLENVFAPPILAKNWPDPLDRSRVRKFLHPFPGEWLHLAVMQMCVDSFLRTRSMRHGLVDDRTLVVVCDKHATPQNQPADYYDGPDWQRVLANRDARLHEGMARASLPHAPRAHALQ